MKPLFTITAILALTSPLSAQLDKALNQVRDSKEISKDATEAAARLGAAIAGRAATESSLDQDQRQQRAQNTRVMQAEADTNRAPDPRETAFAQRGERSMNSAMKNVSPEAGILLAQSATTGPTSAPPRAQVIAEDAPTPVAIPPSPGTGTGPKPAPLKVTSLENPDTAGGSKTIITCTGASYFDANKAIAIFSDNVEVRHPQFFVSCDEFEVHMIKEEAAKSGSKAPPTPPEPPKPSSPLSGPVNGSPPVEVAAPGNESGIKFAIARGRMVVIEKLTETGDIQVGKCRHATYQGSTGDILLRDFPQVQRGNTLQIATDPSTTMTIKQNGELRAMGPSRTEIIKDVPAKKKPGLGSPAAPVPSPNPRPQ